jgi:hypothetical protein
MREIERGRGVGREQYGLEGIAPMGIPASCIELGSVSALASEMRLF